jgi:hypothetical protein
MTMRTYLIVVTVLLASALCYGVYVWYVYQTVASTQEEERASSKEVVPGDRMSTSTVLLDVHTEETSKEPLVLTAESLTPEQQAILTAFGMGDARVVVDDALLRCVGDAIGSERLSEITQGSAPSPREAIKIAACL